MKELEVININDIDYYIVQEIEKGDISYIYLSAVEDAEDTLIRKIDKNDPETILPLENEKEFEIAGNLFLDDIFAELN